jgi:hypothetical protein
MIDELCKLYKITNYTINGDGSIDVDGDVKLSGCDLSIFPLNINNVSGDFDCSYTYLTSLKGCPKKIGGHFYCNVNKLSSLEHSPSVVGGCFICNNNKLTSLEHCPTKIGENFGCGGNKLTSLEHFPTEVGGTLYWMGNELPISFGVVSELTQDEQNTFMKYQSYYDIWTPMLNIDGMTDLIAEIKDGLL